MFISGNFGNELIQSFPKVLRVGKEAILFSIRFVMCLKQIPPEFECVAYKRRIRIWTVITLIRYVTQ